MSRKIISYYSVFVGLVLFGNCVIAQNAEQQGVDALRVYYSDLSQKMSAYQLSDVPFQSDQIVSKRDDSLLRIAAEHRFIELDYLHLAAALYEINFQSFDTKNKNRLQPGTILKLPTVGDLYYAQNRYEQLKVIGEAVDFNHSENRMRSGARIPFSRSAESQAIYSIDELPDNREVTLTSYRVDTQVTANIDEPVIFGSWLDESDIAVKVMRGVELEEEKVTSGILATDAIENSPIDIGKLGISERGKEDEIDLSIAGIISRENAVGITAGSSENNTEQGSAAIVKDAGVELPGSTHGLENPNKPGLSGVDDGGSKSKSFADLAAMPESTKEPTFATLNKDIESYLGSPRDNAELVGDLPADPLSYIVEWDFKENVTVGMAVYQLANYIGYEVVSADDTVLSAYSRLLPPIQQRVSGVTAEDAFTLLAGRGLDTIFDHVARTVKHISRDELALKPMVAQGDDSEAYERILQQTGFIEMLKQFPANIKVAAKRHASRCDSIASINAADAESLRKELIGRFQETSPQSLARNLADWYESPIGRKIQVLERGKIDKADFKRFEVDSRRAERIDQIYENTEIGKVLANIAVELDYTGWSHSGCVQEVVTSGNEEMMEKEMAYGKVIKDKASTLEAMLREDTKRSMAYLFTSLSDVELTEYAKKTREHSVLYSGLQRAIVDVIARKANEVSLSSTE